MTTWAGVRERVRGLRSSGSGVFGAHAHRFELADPLTDGQLIEFEQQLGVALPEDYRGFLREAGAGGAGPGYGLFAPARGADGWAWSGQHDEPLDPAVEFLGEAERARLEAEHSAREPQEPDFPDRESFAAAFRAWDDEWEEVVLRRMLAGSVQLCHQGCGYYHWLVLSGPHRGTVWEDGFATDEPMRRIAPDFRTWYLDWLARAERESGNESGNGDGNGDGNGERGRERA